MRLFNVFNIILTESSTLEAEEAELLKFTNPEKLSLGPAYDGPHLHFPLTLVQLHSVIDAFKKNQVRLIVFRLPQSLVYTKK